MIFKIEIDDFWLNEEQELEPALKQHIITSCVVKISKSIEKKVEDQIEREIKNQVENNLRIKIEKIVSETIATGKIKGQYKGDAELTLEEWIKEQFTKNTGYASPTEKIKELAKKFGDELKNRYDLLFASQLVSKMTDNGFIKDEMIKLLLDSSK